MKFLIHLLLVSSTLAEFTALTGTVSQTASGVYVPATCGSGSSGEYPNVMYTVEPSSDGSVTVSTDPAELVTVSENGGTLSFNFNDAVAKEAKSGAGVLIQMPPDQLKSITSATSGVLQVKSGFTSVESVRAETSGKVDADLSTTTTATSVQAQTSGVATVQMGSGGGDIYVQTSGKANVKGDVTTVKAETSGKAVVDGAIANPSGSSISTSGTINTQDCTDIEPDITGGSCSAGSPSVSVNVDQGPTRTGTYTCQNGDGGWTIGGGSSSTGGSSTVSRMHSFGLVYTSLLIGSVVVATGSFLA